MNEILHANIFFVIASIATVIFSIILCLILYHVLKITKSLRSIIERIEAGSEVIANDVAHVRALIADGGMVNKVFQFIIGATRGRSKSKRDNTKD